MRISFRRDSQVAIDDGRGYEEYPHQPDVQALKRSAESCPLCSFSYPKVVGLFNNCLEEEYSEDLEYSIDHTSLHVCLKRSLRDTLRFRDQRIAVWSFEVSWDNDDCRASISWAFMVKQEKNRSPLQSIFLLSALRCFL